MNINELFITQEDLVKKAELKLKGLERAIEDGDTPDIYNANFYMHGHAWGDLAKLGWAEKEQEPAGGNYMRERWVYKGPNSIKLLTKHSVYKDGKITNSTKEKILQSGEASDWVDVDYS